MRTKREWTKKAIEQESDLELSQRLEDMATVGETEGRSEALRVASKRILFLSRRLGITWRNYNE